MIPALSSHRSVHWATPKAIYACLDQEFHFDLDPCPLHAEFDGLALSWAGRRVFCNPPYGREITKWIAKAHEADLAIFLLPARTDTKWWHEYAMKAQEIRFIRGRLHFNEGGRCPFPCVLIVFKKIT